MDQSKCEAVVNILVKIAAENKDDYLLSAMTSLINAVPVPTESYLALIELSTSLLTSDEVNVVCSGLYLIESLHRKPEHIHLWGNPDPLIGSLLDLIVKVLFLFLVFSDIC